MSLSTPNKDTPSKTHNSLKSMFALFAGGAICYPMLVLKTRRQVSTSQYSYLNMCRSTIRYEGFRGFYKGFGICFVGYMSAQEISNTAFKITKTKFTNNTTTTNSVENKKNIALAGTAGIVASLIAFHFVRVPIDVVTQRLMVQGNNAIGASILCSENIYYKNGFDVFRKIMRSDGPRGLYRGLGISILIKAISFATLTSSSYYVAVQKRKKEKKSNTNNEVSGSRNGSKGVRFWMSAGVATGVSAIVSTPFDTIRTRLQVLDAVDENGRRRPLTFMRTVRNLVNEGGVFACYRGFRPIWASMLISFAIISHLRPSNKSEDKLN